MPAVLDTQSVFRCKKWALFSESIVEYESVVLVKFLLLVLNSAFFCRQRNNVRGVLNNTNFKTRLGGGAGRGGRGGLGRGGARRAPQGHYTPLPKKTVSQLDRELEEYMRKSKHPKIVV